MLATRIPATVITGFLGAGKTTLIRRLIEEADGRRLALIVNEFGDVGVDGDVLAPAAARTVLKKISSNWPMAASAVRSPMIFCRRSSRCWHRRRHRIHYY